MKNIKIGRITLATTFISLGIIIFLNKLMSFNLSDLLFKLWPVVIIVLGTEIIYGSLTKDKKTKVNLDIASISILLVFTVIISSMDLSAKFSRENYKYKDKISEEIIIDEDKKLVIYEDNIDIEVSPSENHETKVKLEGLYRHNEELKDSRLLKVSKTVKGTEVTRLPKEKTVYFMKLNQGDMKYTIQLASGVELELLNKYGDIIIGDIKSNLVINSNTSNIDLENIIGNVSILNSHGDISGRRIVGNIGVVSETGDVDLSLDNVKGLDINTENGDVTLKLPNKQEGKFNIIATYGNIYDELGFNIIESPSMSNINEIRKELKPVINIRVDNGDVILETN